MTSRPAAIAVTVVFGALACGVPLWPVPYSQVRMGDNPSAVTWLFLGAFAGIAGACLLRGRKRVPVVAVTGGFVLAVLLRVAVETSRDPTSHNLWPFEVVIAAAIGGVAAIVGVGLGRLLLRSG